MRYGQHLVHIWLIYDLLTPNVTVRHDFGTFLGRVRVDAIISKMSTSPISSKLDLRGAASNIYFPKFKIVHIFKIMRLIPQFVTFFIWNASLNGWLVWLLLIPNISLLLYLEVTLKLNSSKKLEKERL